MGDQIRSIKGMRDVLPETAHHWRYVETILVDLAEAYGYREIRLPLMEPTTLFARSIGEVTDIVGKEMYTFEDRDGAFVTLRPEGTAGCVRSYIQNGLVGQPQRLYYLGPMFRHENTQRGRYRQFHQFGIETLGYPGPDVDVELIALLRRLWAQLGIEDLVSLELNSLGRPEARKAYRTVLHDYLTAHLDQLDEESRSRLDRNPMRILDSKNPAMQTLIADAPSLLDHLDHESRAHLDLLTGRLQDLGIAYRINPRLVRGLDYYQRTVFEWVTSALGAQGTVCAGGRYDGLVEQLGGKPTPAAGFAIGLERVLLLLEDQQRLPDSPGSDVFMVLVGADAERAGLVLAERMRDELPALKLVVNQGGGGFKAQMRRADRSGARYALILGPDELAADQVTLKPLREDGPQEQIAVRGLADALDQRLAPAHTER